MRNLIPVQNAEDVEAMSPATHLEAETATEDMTLEGPVRADPVVEDKAERDLPVLLTLLKYGISVAEGPT